MYYLIIYLLDRAKNWQPGDNGQVRWAFNCNFIGGRTEKQSGRGEDCGSFCLARDWCRKFAWTSFEGGTCWLKDSGELLNADSALCGEVVDPRPAIHLSASNSNMTTDIDTIQTKDGRHIPVNCRRLQSTFICRANN